MTAGRQPGCQKTGGRRPGSKNRTSEAVKKDVLSCYRRLGGVRWLLAWAEQNPGPFIEKVLCRLLPAPPREDPEPAAGSPATASNLSEIEVARRIAFCLAKAAYNLDQQQSPIEAESSPPPAVPETLPPPLDFKGNQETLEARAQAMADEVPPEPVSYTVPEKFRNPEAAAENKAGLTTHAGSAAEQGHRRKFRKQ